MANSRKLRSPSELNSVQTVFERALEAILARVDVSAADEPRRIAVAYSGGLDSSVLLSLAARYATAHGLTVHAFHIHHGLSPNADEWLDHCQSEAQRQGAEFFATRVSLDQKQNGGTEEIARVARYQALGELCRRHGVSLLLTAHHQDDQAETILLQLMRGAGLPGLSGMPDLQPHHALLGAGVALGRPLLSLTRSMLEVVQAEHGLAYIDDESNLDQRYRRNAVRHQIFPAMTPHFPGFAPLIARSAKHVQAAQELLHDLALIDLSACQVESDGRALALQSLQKLSPQRIDNLLRHWLLRQGVQPPSTARLDEIREQVMDAASDMHPFFDFGAMRLHRVAGRLELHRNLGLPPDFDLTLRWQGEEKVFVPEWHGWLYFDATDGPGCDIDRLRASLVLRPRTGSERLKLAANRPSRGLKNLFQEAGIGARQREWMPLAYIERDLVFVAGLGMDVRHLGDSTTVALRWEPL